MSNFSLTKDFLNSNKILFHFGKVLADYHDGMRTFNPVAIEIHPTSLCNHRCKHCSYTERNEKRIFIKPEIMERLISSITQMGIKAVYFSGGGEPTIYPNISEYVKRLYTSGIEVALITNGTYLEQSKLLDIADMFNYIAVSVPSVNPKMFEYITGCDNLETVLSVPAKIKGVHGEKSPIVGARVILTSLVYKEAVSIITELRNRKYDYVLFKIIRDYEDTGIGLSYDEERYLRELINTEKHTFEDVSFTNMNSIFNYRMLPEFKNTCVTNGLGFIANIDTDGKVYPNIVEISNPEFCIGDINEMPLDEMWNSVRHEEVKEASRKKWLRGECKNCRAMSYNGIMNELLEKLPNEIDWFI